jgi:hypothetical protein
MDDKQLFNIIDSQIRNSVQWVLLGTYVVLVIPILLLIAFEDFGREGFVREIVFFGCLGAAAALVGWEAATQKYSNMWRKRFGRAKCKEFGHAYIMHGVETKINEDGRRLCFRCTDMIDQ